MNIRYSVITAIIVIILLTPPTTAQQNLTLDIQAGYDAYYKADTWVPVQVTISNQGTDLSAAIHLLDNQANFDSSNILYVYPINLPAGSRKQITLYMPLRGQTRLAVKLVDEHGTTLLTDDTPVEILNPQDYLIGVIATDPSLLNPLIKFSDIEKGQRVAVAHLQPGNLPPNIQAWDALDLLVFNNIDTSQLTPAQQQALDSWVRRGGHLVVGGGPNALQTIAGLSHLLPFSSVSIENLSHPLTGLSPFISKQPADRGPYVAALPTNLTGTVLASENGQPLIVSILPGQGQVNYLALDLGLAPLDTLVGDFRFFPQLTDFQSAQYIFPNRAAQRDMRSSLAQIPDQTLPKPATVAIFLLIYILVLGPLNYAVLSRFKKKEWAWLTIPLIILLFTAYGYISGFRLRSGRPLLRQITVIQSNPKVALAHLDSFIGIYSPFRADYSLSIITPDNNIPALVASLPDSFGLSNQLTVSTDKNTAIDNLRSDIGGLPSVVVHSQTNQPAITAQLTYNETTGTIKGDITNNTGQPLTHAQLVSGNRVLFLDTLPPGQTDIHKIMSALDIYQFYPIDNIDTIPTELATQLASKDLAAKAVLQLNDGLGQLPNTLSGLYLIGWQEGSPVSISLPDSNSDTMNDTLFLIELGFSSF